MPTLPMGRLQSGLEHFLSQDTVFVARPHRRGRARHCSLRMPYGIK
jgi:hypothetical protein